MNEQRIWFKGENKIFQNLSLAEKKEFWKDIDKKANGGAITQTIRFIKEFCTASALGDKIYNCHEGGLVWLHEMGHIERFKNKKLLHFYANLIFFSSSAFALSHYYYPIAFDFIALLWGFFLLGIEIDAWIYAFRNWKG